ncbi:MAG: hypothetical protein ACLURV_00515 [Gallintestinimicrobium sp.]
MNCREKILSEDYMSILLDYVPEEANQEDEAFCYQQVDGTLGIYYLDRSAVLPLSPVNYLSLPSTVVLPRCVSSGGKSDVSDRTVGGLRDSGTAAAPAGVDGAQGSDGVYRYRDFL